MDEYDELYVGEEGFWSEEDLAYFEGSFEPEQAFGLVEHCRHCVPAVVSNYLLWHVVSLCLLQLFVRHLRFLPSFVPHSTAALFGLFACSKVLDSTQIAALLALVIIAYLVIRLTFFLQLRCGFITTGVCFVFMILCQCLVFDAVSFNQLRGYLMILVMKLGSVAFDLEDGNITTDDLDIIKHFGYSLDIGTVVFGPWMTFQQYSTPLEHISTQASIRRVLFGVCRTLPLSLLFLVCSDCLLTFIPIYLDQYASWVGVKWLLAFCNALSFRFGHYFVSKFSEAVTILSGHGFHSTVTNPLMIELPRSLVDVVIHWNIPMHCWLKKYIFRPTADGRLAKLRSRSSANLCAILLTYLSSSLLHGFDFQLSAVLLSLGILSFSEHGLRRKLSKAFDACIDSRSCQNCEHRSGKYSCAVVITNLAFSLLAVFHLAYLGMVFDSSEVEDEGYGWSHTMGVWSQVGFTSHLIGAVTLVVSLVM